MRTEGYFGLTGSGVSNPNRPRRQCLIISAREREIPGQTSSVKQFVVANNPEAIKQKVKWLEERGYTSITYRSGYGSGQADS